MRKTLIYIGITLGVATATFAQSSDRYAKVQSIDGKKVFVLNEPASPYKTVGKVNTGIKLTSLLTRGLLSEDISDKTTQYVRKAGTKAKRKNIEFDGLIYRSGRKADLIKFDDKVTFIEQSKAKVSSINGVFVFLMAEPLFAYEVEKGLVNLFDARSLVSQGLWNTSIEQETRRFTRKVNRKTKGGLYMSYDQGRRVNVLSPLND